MLGWSRSAHVDRLQICCFRGSQDESFSTSSRYSKVAGTVQVDTTETTLSPHKFWPVVAAHCKLYDAQKMKNRTKALLHSGLPETPEYSAHRTCNTKTHHAQQSQRKDKNKQRQRRPHSNEWYHQTEEELMAALEVPGTKNPEAATIIQWAIKKLRELPEKKMRQTRNRSAQNDPQSCLFTDGLAIKITSDSPQDPVGKLALGVACRHGLDINLSRCNTTDIYRLLGPSMKAVRNEFALSVGAEDSGAVRIRIDEERPLRLTLAYKHRTSSRRSQSDAPVSKLSHRLRHDGSSRERRSRRG